MACLHSNSISNCYRVQLLLTVKEDITKELKQQNAEEPRAGTSCQGQGFVLFNGVTSLSGNKCGKHWIKTSRNLPVTVICRGEKKSLVVVQMSWSVSPTAVTFKYSKGKFKYGTAGSPCPHSSCKILLRLYYRFEIRSHIQLYHHFIEDSDLILYQSEFERLSK